MKKITLLFFILLSWCSYSQLANESFDTWPPAGWGIYDNGIGTNVTWAQNNPANSLQPGYSPPYAAYLDHENSISGIPEDWLITPQFQVPLNGQLRFYSRLTQPGNQGSIYKIMVSTSSDQSDLAAYTTVQQWTESQINPTQTEYTEKVVTLPATTVGQQVYLAFVMLSDNGDRWLIDDVRVVSQCNAPTELSATGIGTTTAMLNWTESNGATTWEVAVMPTTVGFNGTGTSYTGPLPYPATGLLEDTAYKFYVRSMCSSDNPSTWAGPFNFTTVGLGDSCDAPVNIAALPFSITSNTSNYGNFYTGFPGAACGNFAWENYLFGNDVVYAYTATETGIISVNMSNNGAYAGMFVYTSCAAIGGTCAAGGTAGWQALPVSVNEFNVTLGQTYYIVISSYINQTTPYTLTVQKVNCTPPSGLTVSNVGVTSAGLSWNANGASSWEVVVQAPGTGIPVGAGVTTTVNTNYNVTQTFDGTAMEEATVYEYYVRADCGDGSFSAWTGPFTFLTSQVPATLNYTQDFEGDHGWGLSNGSQTNHWHVGTAANNGGTHSLYISNDNGVSNTYSHTTSIVHAYRDIQMPASVDQVSLSFDWKSLGENNWDYFTVWLVPSTFTPTAGTEITTGSGGIQIGGNFQNSTAWTTFTTVINASVYSGDGMRLIFEWQNDGGGGFSPPAAIDNINLSVITCPSPTALALDNVGQDVASFIWQAPASVAPTYDYYISTTNTAPVAGTTPTGNTADTNITLTTLTPSTSYFFWVRSNCGTTDGNSFWIGPVAFNTTQIPAVMNFTEDFEGAIAWTLNNGTQTNQWATGTAINNGGTHALYISNDGGTSNNYSHTNTIVQAYRDIQMPAAIDQVSLSFDWKSVGENNWDYFTVWLVPSTFTPTAGTEINAGSGGIQIGGNFQSSSAWTTYTTIFDASAYSGDVMRIVFEWQNDGGGGSPPPAAIDNIQLSLITCSSPSDLTLDSFVNDVANISWQGPSTGTPTFDYYLSETTTAPGDTTTPTGNTSNEDIVLNSLEPSTNYYFWVRSNCGTTDGNSFWVGPIAFSTSQIPATTNFYDNLEGDINWTLSNGNQINKWVAGTAVSSSPSHSLYISNDNGVNNDYFNTISSVVHAYRDIQMPGTVTDIDISFDWKNNGENNWDYIRVWLVPTTFTPTPGTQITTSADRQQVGGNHSGQINWVTADYITNASAFAGQTMRLVFEWRNDTSGGFPKPGAIDNINVTVITCPKPITLTVGNIGQTTAELGWTNQGTAAAWEVYVVEEGSPAPAPDAVGIPAPTNPFTVTNLDPYTNYKYYVRAICSASDKSVWSGPLNFTTAISNDDCAGAVTVPVNPTEECAQFTSAAFTGATASSQATTCTGVNGGDIWFEFTATYTSHSISLSNFGGTAQPVVLSLYEGDDCAALTPMYCSYTNVINASGLVIGNIYKIRATLNNSSAALNTSFDVCVNTPPPPANSNQAECIITTINYDFELPQPSAPTIYPHFVSHHTVQGWRTTAADEQMEFWPTPNYENVPAYSGIQFIELNANLVSGVYQDYATPQPTVFTYGFAHRGRQGTDTCQLLAGPPGGPYVPIETATTGNTAWVYYTGNYTVPAGQTVTRFIFQSISSVGGASVGNYLDAITFTANNGLLSENPMALDCQNNIANISAAGVGSWSAHTDNPTATTIAGPNSNDTTISGFSATGVYRYDWTTQYCTSTLIINFDGGNIPAPVTTNVMYCQNETAIPLTAEALTGNFLNWYVTETGGTPLAGAPTPDTAVTGPATYYVSQSSAQGCESPRAAITVTVNELPAAPVAADVTYCLGATASQLSAEALPGNTLNWYTTATGGTALTQAPTPVTDTQATYTYYVSQQTANGCEGPREEVTVSINWNNSAIPVTDFDYEDIYCFDVTNAAPQLAAGFVTGGTFTASNGLAIDPVTGEVNIASAVPGVYTITYTVEADLTLCNPGGSSTDTFTISGETLFTLEGDCHGSEYIITPVTDADLEGASYEWANAGGMAVGNESTFNVTNYVNSTPAEDTFPLEFMLTVTVDGCESSRTYTVDGISCSIQRGISPNNDQLNDSFDLSFMNVKHLSIFNRYGKEVYSLSNYTNEWGGQDKSGNELPTGTYFYSIERNNGEAKTGWIYINREE